MNDTAPHRPCPHAGEEGGVGARTHLLEEVLERLLVLLHETVHQGGPRHVTLAGHSKLLVAQVVQDLGAVL